MFPHWINPRGYQQTVYLPFAIPGPERRRAAVAPDDQQTVYLHSENTRIGILSINILQEEN
jgi:hypothetical protein